MSLQLMTANIFKGFGNVLFNGFDSDLSNQDKVKQVGLQLKHFSPISQWTSKGNYIVDQSTQDRYFADSQKMVRLKCTALFLASFAVQPIGLTLNLFNRIGKIVTFAHLWNPSREKYCFRARLDEWGKDILLVISTPLIFVGMIFSSLYGTVSPYDGRKLYATLERFSYSGCYQFFSIHSLKKLPNNFLLAPCFQPEPKVHLGGGNVNKKDVW